MKLKSAVSWTIFTVVIISMMRMLGNLSLARLLPSDAFGLASIVFAVTSGIEAISDVGASPSLIRSHRTDADWLDTAWTLSLVRGIAIALIIALVAIPTAAFFNEPRLAPLIAVSGLASVLGGIRSNQMIIAMRDLQAKPAAMVDLFTAILGYIVMVIWAWLAPSAWALLAGTLIMAVTSAILSFTAFGYRPHRFCWNREVLAELVHFGKWIFLASLLGFIIFQGDRIIIGKTLGLHEAGIYSIAFAWSGALLSISYLILHRLYMPVIANIKRTGKPVEIVSNIRHMILSALIIPYALVAGIAEQLISFLYPETYAGAGLILSIMVIGVWFSALELIYNDQLMVSGEPARRSFAQILSIIAVSISLLMFWKSLNLAFIAYLFVGGIFLRAIILMYYSSRDNFKSIIPDIAISIAFIMIFIMIRYFSSIINQHYSAMYAILICSICAMPFGGVVGWIAIRRVLQLAPDQAVDMQTDDLDEMAGSKISSI